MEASEQHPFFFQGENLLLSKDQQTIKISDFGLSNFDPTKGENTLFYTMCGKFLIFSQTCVRLLSSIFKIRNKSERSMQVAKNDF